MVLGLNLRLSLRLDLGLGLRSGLTMLELGIATKLRSELGLGKMLRKRLRSLSEIRSNSRVGLG